MLSEQAKNASLSVINEQVNKRAKGNEEKFSAELRTELMAMQNRLATAESNLTNANEQNRILLDA